MKHFCLIGLLISCYAVDFFGQTPALGIPFGHTEHVSSLDFSQDGKYLLSGSYDGTLKLWEVSSGKLLKSSKNQSGPMLAGATLSPKANYAEVNWSMTEALPLVWDIQNNQFIGKMENIIGFSDTEDFFLYSEYFQDIEYKWDAVEQELENPKQLTFSPNGVMPDGRNFYKILPNKIELWSTLTFQKVQTIEIPGLGTSASLARNGKVLYEQGAGRLKVWSLENPNQIYTYDLRRGEKVHAFGPKGELVLISSRVGTFSLLDLKAKKITRRFSTYQRSSNSYVTFKELVGTLSPLGKIVATGTPEGIITLQDAETGKVLNTLRSHVNPIEEISFRGQQLQTVDNCKNQRTWSLEQGYIQAFQLADKSLVQELRRLNPSRRAAQILSPDQKLGLSWDDQDRAVQPLIIDLENGPDTFRLASIAYQHWIEDGIFSPQATKVLIREGYETNPEPSSVYIWDIASGKLDQKITEESGSWPISTAISEDDLYVALGTWSGEVKLYEINSGKLVHNFRGHSGKINAVVFNSTKDQLYSSAEDGTVRIWGIKEKKELAQLIEIDDNDWIVLSPNGMFDASPAAMNKMYYTLQSEGDWEVIELEQLKSRYYEPGLLAKVLKLSDEPLRSVEGFGMVPMYPKLDWTIDNDLLEVNLKARNGGIGALSLFINGKGVDLDINPNRKTQVKYDLRPHQRYLYRHPDSTNLISLRAFNQEGWLKSPAYNKSYQPQAWSRGAGEDAAGNPGEPLDPKMYIIAVGTSEYSGEQLDLKYADQDAAMMAAALESVGRKLFSDSLEIHCLSTKSPDSLGLSDYGLQWQFANRENIKQVFMDTKQKAKAEDVVVVYFSGHGITYGSAEEAQFYYLTHAMREPELSDRATRDQYTISSEDLTQWLNEIPALKQVIIIDACNSGKVIDHLSSASKSLNSSQIRALDRMKDRTGMFILSGSAADKVSFEASAFGQGLLTYALLKGMLGVATIQTAKGTFVDVMNLFQYARDEVPRLAESINGIQSPVLGFPSDGSSFDIGIFDNSIRIPVANKKPVFVSSKIWNQESFEDEKGIQERINAALRKEAESGAQANLIYVDVVDYPAAYSIRGAYTVNDDEITIRIKLFQPEKETIDLEAFSSNDPDWLTKKVIKEVKKLMKE